MKDEDKGVDRIGKLEKQLQRRGKSLEYLQLITKTFVSLNLTEKNAICDTLTSMVSSFLEVKQSFMLVLTPGGDGLETVGAFNVPEVDALIQPAASAFWAFLMGERTARFVGKDEFAQKWPDAPDFLGNGFASVSLDVRDRPVGLMVFANRTDGDEFIAEDMELLSSVAGIAAMALTNAEAIVAQRELISEVELKALEAQRAAAEKQRALAELDQQLEIIKRQQFAIRELSTPVLQLWDDVLALPIIGVVDTRRSVEIMERLLAEVTNRQSKYVILDITGVEVVDTKTADHFIKVVKAAELLGTTCVLTGIRPAVAQTLVEIGVDLSRVLTLRNLQDGLRECLRMRKARASTVATLTSGV